MATPANMLIRRFSVAEYEQLIQIGMLKPKDPYHLINGVIRCKMPKNAPHLSTTAKLNRLLQRQLPDEFFLLSDAPISFVNSTSQPEPDFAITAGPVTRFDSVKPVAADVMLIIEVAESSLTADRSEMLEIYAAGKIAEYWIVNLVDQCIEVYTQPKGGKKPTYKSRVDYSIGQSVPVILNGKQVGAIPVADVLPGGA